MCEQLTMQHIFFSSGMVAAPIPDDNKFHIIIGKCERFQIYTGLLEENSKYYVWCGCL